MSDNEPPIDPEDLRSDAQTQIEQFLRRQHDLPYLPDVEVGPLSHDPGPFPDLAWKFTGELFLSASRLASNKDELQAALERIDQGIKAEQILEGRVRSNTSGVEAQAVANPFWEDEGKKLTLSGHLRLDAHF
jgi:hypothetical protein